MKHTTVAALYRIRLQQDARKEGLLTVIPDDGPLGLGISVRRVFTVTDVPAGGVRGDHAHRDCTQVVVCLRGAVQIVIDDGNNAVDIRLSGSEEALFIPPGLWNHLTFDGPDTVVAVFCDQPYKESDYLRDRAEYKVYKGIGA